MLKAKNLRKVYDGKTALNDVTYRADQSYGLGKMYFTKIATNYEIFDHFSFH